jgi:AmmeMemoRadiSam system protein B
VSHLSVRPAAVANTFYPGSPYKLAHHVKKLLQKAKHEAKKEKTVEKFENIIGLIAPHAGYLYSGYTAATAYSLLEPKKFKTVIIIAPSHHECFEGVSIFSGDYYETPLGKVELDNKLITKISENDKEKIIIRSEEGHGYEHAIEVQIPLLQETLPGFKLVPLVIGKQSTETCEKLSNLLVDVLKDEEKVLMVASSDLSHFYTSETAKKIDRVCLDAVSNFDTNKLIENLRKTTFEACGAGPMACVALTAKKLGAEKSKVTHYCNSGDTTADYSSVVGYMAAIFFK